jgi:hypothetical protein
VLDGAVGGVLSVAAGEQGSDVVRGVVVEVGLGVVGEQRVERTWSVRWWRRM